MNQESKPMTSYDFYLLGVCFGRAPEARCMMLGTIDKLKTTEERWAFALGMQGHAVGPENFEEMRRRAFAPEGLIMFGGAALMTISDLGIASPKVLCEKFDRWMVEKFNFGIGGYYTSQEDSERIAKIPSFYVSPDEAKRTSASELRTRFDKWLLEHSDSESAAEQPLYAGRIVAVLDCLLELDRAGLSAVLMTRHPVSEALADCPNTISAPDGQLGALGLLNGLLPKRADGRGIIVADYDEETGFIQRFRLVTEMPLPPDVEAAVAQCEKETNRAIDGAQDAAVPPSIDWTGEYLLDWNGAPQKPATAIGLRGDVIVLKCDDNELAFNRDNGQCVTGEHRGLLWISQDDMPRVKPPRDPAPSPTPPR